MTVLEAGPGLSDPALLAETANGLRLPIGAASPLVQRYQAQLTDRPPRQMAIMRGSTVGGSGAVNGGYFCRGLQRDFEGFGIPGWAWSEVVDSLSRDRDRPGFHRARPRRFGPDTGSSYTGNHRQFSSFRRCSTASRIRLAGRSQRFVRRGRAAVRRRRRAAQHRRRYAHRSRGGVSAARAGPRQPLAADPDPRGASAYLAWTHHRRGRPLVWPARSP